MSISTIFVKDIDEKLRKGIKDSDYFKPSSPATADIGGIERGWFPEDGKITVSEFLDKLIHPTTAPHVVFSSNPSTGLREVGDIIQNPVLTTLIERTTDDIKSLELFKNNTKIYAKTTEIASGGTFSYTDTAGITTTTTYKTVVADVHTTEERSITYDFTYAMYVGVTTKDINSVTQADIKACEKRIALKSNQVKNFSHYGKRIIFAYPKSYGNLKEIKDMNGFVLNGFTQKTITVQNDYGQSTSYNVYIANDISDLSNYRIHFNF